MNKKTIVAIIFIIVLVAIIGAVYFLAGRNNETNGNQTINDPSVNLGNANEANNETNNENQTSETTSEGLKTLIVYFSVPETDNPNNMTQDEENSTVVVNGEVLGNWLQEIYN